MGKWFQNKSFSTEKREQGIKARKGHRGINARKIHRDIKARKASRAFGILLAAALVFQTVPFEGIAVSASESSGAGCANTTGRIRRTAATKRQKRGMGVPMSIWRTVTGQWREKTAAPQRSRTAIMNMTNPAATGRRRREAPVPSCVRYAGAEQTKYRKIRRTVMR